MEKEFLRKRQEICGPSPQSRIDFEPEIFLEKIYGDKENVIVMDSDNLREDWKSRIEKVNPNSEYDWDKVNDEMRD